MAEFMLTLRREPTPTTEAMQNGIDFEDLVTSIINGRGDPNNQWYAAAEKVARRCAGYHYDDADDARRVAILHPEEADEIAQDGDDVGHDAALLLAQLVGCPALAEPVEVDKQRGCHHGKQINHGKHHQLVCHRQQRHVAEDEQGYESHYRQIEGGEDHAHDSRSQYDILLFHKSNVICILSLFLRRVLADGNLLLEFIFLIVQLGC